MPDVPEGHVDQLHPWIKAVRHRSDGAGFTAEQTARARAGYYACVSYVDEKVGEILRELDQLGLTEDTLVVYTSDHGEMMGAHDMWGKRTFYEGSSRVPFIVRWPTHLPAGTRVPNPAELVDLYPTLCAAAGATPPADLDGDNLLPLLSGDSSSWRNTAVSDYVQWLPAPARMVRRGPWKLNYYTGAGFELVDLHADPHELHDLSSSPDHQPTIRDLLRNLARGGWSPQIAEAVWRDYQRRGPTFPKRPLRTPNQYWAGGPPYRDAEDFYPTNVDWNRIPIRP